MQFIWSLSIARLSSLQNTSGEKRVPLCCYCIMAAGDDIASPVAASAQESATTDNDSTGVTVATSPAKNNVCTAFASYLDKLSNRVCQPSPPSRWLSFG